MRTRIVITLSGIAIAIGHQIWPYIKLDNITIIGITIAIIPWLSSIIKSLELPGGFKIELQDIRSATKKVVGIGAATLPSVSASSFGTGGSGQTNTEQIASKLRNVAENDPNLALVGVGIEIENRLLDLAEKHRVDAIGRKSAGQLLWNLQEAKIIPSAVASGLRELIALRNQAAHGAVVTAEAAAWALNELPSILAVMEKLVSETNAT